MITDSNSDIYACYMVIFRGDLNGDAVLDPNDTKVFKYMMGGVDGYAFDSEDRYMRTAMDVDGDYDIGPNDTKIMKYYIGLSQDFDQSYIAN